MSVETKSDAERPILASSAAGGGLPRHYRVQYQPPMESNWRMYGSFRTRQQADACVKTLLENGYPVRMVAYSICPAAA